MIFDIYLAFIGVVFIGFLVSVLLWYLYGEETEEWKRFFEVDDDFPLVVAIPLLGLVIGIAWPIVVFLAALKGIESVVSKILPKWREEIRAKKAAAQVGFTEETMAEFEEFLRQKREQ